MLPSVQKLVSRRIIKELSRIVKVKIIVYFSKISLDVACTSD